MSTSWIKWIVLTMLDLLAAGMIAMLALLTTYTMISDGNDRPVYWILMANMLWGAVSLFLHTIEKDRAP